MGISAMASNSAPEHSEEIMVAQPVDTIPAAAASITTGGVKRRDELKDSDEELKDARGSGWMVKCLIVRCHATKWYSPM